MKITWDVTEITEFAEKLSDITNFDNHLKKATKEISKALLKRIKGYTPVQDYDLINAWDKNKFLVTGTANGYEVLLVNDMEYARYVNDGHRQKPGRFIPGYWSTPTKFVYDRNANGGMVLKQSFVKGRFFVEKGIISLTNVTEIESIIMRELQRWWDSL